jgi:hypothetical protein
MVEGLILPCQGDEGSIKTVRTPTRRMKGTAAGGSSDAGELVVLRYGTVGERVAWSSLHMHGDGELLLISSEGSQLLIFDGRTRYCVQAPHPALYGKYIQYSCAMKSFG